jgi:transcriptional regulator with XRE-family HTH domain
LNLDVEDDMADPYGPQAIWGRELRHYRLAAGLTQAQLAARIKFAESLISGCENGHLQASPEFAAACDEALKTGGALVRLLDYRKGSRFPSWFGEWPIIESKSVRLRNFEQAVMPGLLQKEAYATALFNGDKDKVAARLERQQILFRDDPPLPKLYVLIDEAALLRPVGGPEVMREQLEYLIEAAVLPHISVQAIPHGVHPCLSGAFCIASLGASNGEVAYVDTGLRGQIARNPEDIEELNDTWNALQTYALPQRESLQLIKKTVEERWT